jgi:hypothetical protein
MKNIKTPALLLLATIALGTAVRAEVIEQVLVKVNGEIFTKTDLENRQVDALRGMGQQTPSSRRCSTRSHRSSLSAPWMKCF